MKLFRILAVFAALSCTALTLSSCRESETENAIEDAGEGIEETAEDAMDATEGAIEDAGDAVKETAEDVEDAAE